MYEYANIASVASHKRAEVHERAKKSEKVQRESDVFYNALRAYNIGETTFETFYYSFYRDPYHKKIAVRKLK